MARWGFAAGAVIACLPVFLCSWIFLSFIGAAYNTLGGLKSASLQILGQTISFNLLDALNLKSLYDTLGSVAAWGFFGFLFLGLLGIALLGFFSMLAFYLLGLFYNMTGRVRVEVADVRPTGELQQGESNASRADLAVLIEPKN